MVEFVAKLFSFAGVEPHVPRFLQQSDILWLPVLSDLCMALANYAILYWPCSTSSAERQELICKRPFLMFWRVYVLLWHDLPAQYGRCGTGRLPWRAW